MKTFLSYTAIIEAATGILLLLFPSKIVLLLLQSPLDGNAAIIATMLAGAAILTTAIAAWMMKNDINKGLGVIIMFVYNLLVTLLLLYGLIAFEFKSILLWGIILFHTFQTFFSVYLLKKKK